MTAAYTVLAYTPPQGRHAGTYTEAARRRDAAFSLFPPLDDQPRHRKEGTS